MPCERPEAPPSTPTSLREEGARDTRRALGERGEQLAVEHLQRLGYRVLARNVRSAAGEIDAIALAGESIVFVEVKTRRGDRVAPVEGLRPLQRARLRRAAARWLGEHPERPRAAAIRFDAIGVSVDPCGRLLRLDHIEGAW